MLFVVLVVFLLVAVVEVVVFAGGVSTTFSLIVILLLKAFVTSTGSAPVVLASIGVTVIVPVPTDFAVPVIVILPSTHFVPLVLSETFEFPLIETFPLIPDIVILKLSPT